MRFNGPNYDPEEDNHRLIPQYWRIFKIMEDGKWRSLRRIEQLSGDPQSSISAQLRHMRKERFGSHTVEKRAKGPRKRGLWQYKLKVNVRQE